ncbi:MAG: hypothetical protein B6245_01560 [Desulfobacteraceae bacterium 4572_88]|nr:MAG: hypothetical protein B6245_01560 [Desulfobacteraceae bacterium 4572_88]
MQNQQESRLDRIEKYLAMFIQSVSEMRQAQETSQEKTDEQIRGLKTSQDKTDEQIRGLKTSQDKTSEQIRELKTSQDKTSEQIRELKTSQDKTIRRLDDVGKQLGDMGFVQGEIAEDLFYRNVKYVFRDRKLVFDSVTRNLKKKGVAEYDIVASGRGEILVIEVKNKLTARMVDKFVSKTLPKFRKVFPKYKNSKLMGGMGALVIKDEVGRYAEDAGLYVLTQNSEGGAAIANRKDFKAKLFA